MPGKIRKDYCAQKAGANGYETLTFLSWERHGQLDDRSKGTVIMGLRSGRGDRGAGRHGSQHGTGHHGRSSLVGDTRRDGYRGADGYGRPYDYCRPGEYGQPGYQATSAGQALRAEFDLGDGGRGGQGRHGRKARSRRRGGSRFRGMPVPVLAVIAVVASLAVVAAAVGATHAFTATTAADATAPNANCTLIVPANPLSAQGLATPYQLTATDPADGPCNEANGAQTAFVQGAIIDPATGTISIYDPLVVDAGTKPAVTPAAPTLPAGAVVAVWFGYNGDTLSLAGADQAQSLLDPASASATPTGTPPSTGTQSGQTTAPPSTSATQAAVVTGPGQRAGLEVSGSAPLPPAGAGFNAGYDATLTRLGSPGSGAGAGAGAGQTGNPPRRHRPSPPPSVSASASGTASASPSGSAGTPTDPPATGDSPAASGTPDAILQQANCVAGEDINGQFSSFTQVGACNAPAFFTAANAAITAGKLTVPQPGLARDGQRCLTTRSFALIDQDQSDNVTTEYLAEPDGRIAQDTAANRQGLGGASTLFNGSDNGLLDLFVDPALGCSPWEAPNLADGGTPAPSLPLDELQAARWADSSGPGALVPLNDPMTVDPNGNFSTDKTNTYRSLVDMPQLPAGQSPATYCSDMEQIQGKRIQQDVNLLLNAPSPSTAAADNLFTFLSMRLQQSFQNLNCGNFGQQNDVSFSSDGNGVVVAACFVRQFAPVTRGPGNPMRGQRQCPATVGSAPGGVGTPTATPTPTPSQSNPGSPYMRKHHRHWWW